MYFFKQCGLLFHCASWAVTEREIITGDLKLTGNWNQGVNANHFIIVTILRTTYWLIPWFPDCVLRCPRAPLWTRRGAVRYFNFLREAALRYYYPFLWMTLYLCKAELLCSCCDKKQALSKNQCGTGAQVVVANLILRSETFYSPQQALSLFGPTYLISGTLDISFGLGMLWKNYWDTKGTESWESLGTSCPMMAILALFQKVGCVILWKNCKATTHRP